MSRDGRPIARAFTVFAAMLLLAARAARAAPAADGAAREAAPSDIEQHVARAIAFSYLRNEEALEKEYLFFKGLDGFLSSRRQPATGLSDDVLDLMLSTITDPDAYTQARRALMDEIPDEELRELVNSKFGGDLKSADSLLLTDRYNRFAFIFNTFVRPLSLAAVGYFPALIDAGLATALNVGKLTELSVEEKKALVLYKKFLARYPDSDNAELLRRRVTTLDRKRVAAAHDAALALGEERLAADDCWQAQQHFKNALAYIPGSPKASDGLKRAREAEMKKAVERSDALRPADTRAEPASGGEEEAYRAVLYATIAGAPEMMILRGEELIQRYPASAHVPETRYAIAVAHDMKGAHEKAKELLRKLAAGYPGTPIGNRAAAYLADPEYNLKLAYQRSQRRYDARTMQYVVMGDEFVKSNVILGTSRIVTQGLQAFESLGTFNVMALLIRGVNALIRNPVSDQEIIDTGVDYLRRYPDSAAAPDVHLALASAYMKRQNLSKALYHYTASGRVSAKKVAKLREKAAAQYLDFANAAQNNAEKIRCYETVLDEYPHTAAAVKALEQLALVEKAEKPLFALDKATLAEYPMIFTLASPHLGPNLLDGDLENGELAPRGLYSTQRGKITLVYRDKSGEKERMADLDYPAYKRLMAFAEEISYRKTLAAGDGKALAGKFPVELRGTVGGDGVYVYPRLKVRGYQEKDLYLYK